NDTYRGDREMTICAMEGVVARARRDMDRTQRDALLGVNGEMRRLLELASVPAAPFDTALAQPSLYCRALSGLQRIVTPTAAQAEEHTSELQSRRDLVCRLLLEKKKSFQSSAYSMAAAA